MKFVYSIKKYFISILTGLIVVFSSVGICVAQQPDNDKIAIGSFNIQIFGKTKIKKQHLLTVLAETATNFDIMAIQEVGSNGSKASDEVCKLVMDTYTQAINSFMKASVYQYVRSNQYGIVYRTDKVQLIKSKPYSGSEKITYNPLTAYFKTIEGDFDFCFVTVHTRPELAKREIPELKTVMSEVSKEYGDPDVICAGDYNGDGSYYNEGQGENLAGFDGYITGIPNSAKTNVANNHDYTYDRMEMTSALKTDFTGEWGVFEISKHYDVSSCEGSRKIRGKEAALSDHYPVWCIFYIDRDTD
jgi:deoxyribonuclease-1-like protein